MNILLKITPKKPDAIGLLGGNRLNASGTSDDMGGTMKYLAQTDRRQLIVDEEMFTNGFSLGARIMCDVFKADEA